MCGIAGYSGSYPPSVLPSMSSALHLRGPDGSGEFSDDAAGIGLAHRRLSIIDLSDNGAQPLHDVEDRAVVAYNGEIYNFRELRKELKASGFRFRGHSDTEVLLNLYLRDGPDMLAALNGIFAFAIWDREKRELLLARDGLGVKPLYYAEGSRGVVFASEIKALRPVLDDSSLDVVALSRYLSFLWCPGEGTPFRSVRKLGPGDAMIVRDGRIARRWSWSRLPTFRRPTPLRSVPEVIRGVEQGLRTAVTRQLVADVPVGSFLSGGLDSSAIVAFARESVPDLRCFTIEVDGGQESDMADDLPYAKQVARHLGVRLDVVNVQSRDMAADFPAMVTALDEPLADPAPLNVLYISRLAREHGIKVLLSGAGGDDLFSGYRRHVAVMVAAVWGRLPRTMRTMAASAASRLDRRKPLARRISKALSGAALEGDERIANWFQWIPEDEVHRLFTRDARKELTGTRVVEPLIDFVADLDVEVHPLDRMLALEQRFFLCDHNLNYTDKMSMAASVETRVPFLDPDLMSFAARIPPKLKQHGRVSKWAFKRAMEPYLPRNVIYRPKTGFGVPLRRWLRKELVDVVADVLSPSTLKNRGLFEPQAVADLVRRDAAGEIDATYPIFSLMCIELWCRSFRDAWTSEPSPLAQPHRSPPDGP